MPDYNILSTLKNYIFVSAVSAWFIAQIVKVIVNLCKKDRPRIKHFLFGTGGMPSSHSAVVCALMMSSLLQYGFTSFQFAVSGILAVIVIRDATGVRFEAGEQAKFLNQMIEERGDELPETDAKFKERLGHTPLEVFCGSLLGLIVAFVFAIIYNVIFK